MMEHHEVLTKVGNQSLYKRLYPAESYFLGMEDKVDDPVSSA